MKPHILVIAGISVLVFGMVSHAEITQRNTPARSMTAIIALPEKLLFNGRDLEGWHNFKTTSIRPGWQVKDGALTCVDPHDAGDLCTKDQYDWFELQLDYGQVAFRNIKIRLIEANK